MEELKQLCNEYKQYLRQASLNNASDRLYVHRNDEKLTTIDLLLFNTNPKCILFLLLDPKGPQYKARLEKENRSTWVWSSVIGLLVLATCPISVPVLMLWSWLKRGDPNFLKSESTIFVEKLVRISQAALQQTSDDEAFNETPSFSSDSDSDSDEDEAEPKIVRRYPNLFGAFCDLDADLLNDTGKPQVLASRIRPFNAANDEYLEIDFHCGFKYTDKTEVFTIQVPLNCDPIAMQAPIAALETSQEEVPQDDDGIVSTIMQKVQGLFFATPNFEDMMEEVEAVEGFHAKRVAYEKALALATNDTQHILAVEGIINQLDIECEKHIEARFYDRPEITPSAEQLRLDNVERREQRIKDILTKTNVLYDALPTTYRTIMTPAVRKLLGTFETVFELLAQNKIGEAHWHYDSICRTTPTSPFIKLAFPNIPAMRRQIWGIFCLVDFCGYGLELELEAPSNKALQKNALSFYLDNGEIWCATRTPENRVDRFMLEDSTLGGQADEIRRAILTKMYHVFSNQEDKIYAAVAHRGYYKTNVFVCPRAAHECFREAHELVQAYHPERAARLETMVLETFERVNAARWKARRETPLEVKKAKIRQQRAEVEKKLIKCPPIAPPPVLSEAQWAELFALNNTTPSYMTP